LFGLRFVLLIDSFSDFVSSLRFTPCYTGCTTDITHKLHTYIRLVSGVRVSIRVSVGVSIRVRVGLGEDLGLDTLVF